MQVKLFYYIVSEVKFTFLFNKICCIVKSYTIPYSLAFLKACISFIVPITNYILTRYSVKDVRVDVCA